MRPLCGFQTTLFSQSDALFRFAFLVSRISGVGYLRLMFKKEMFLVLLKFLSLIKLTRNCIIRWLSKELETGKRHVFHSNFLLHRIFVESFVRWEVWNTERRETLYEPPRIYHLRKIQTSRRLMGFARSRAIILYDINNRRNVPSNQMIRNNFSPLFRNAIINYSAENWI